MKFTAAALLLATPSALAFAPLAQTTTTKTTTLTESVSPEEPSAPLPPAINGWVPDATKPCYGLPGAILPFEASFDPAGFAKDAELGDVKRFREAEVMHGRVAMMAVVGYLVTENTPTMAFGEDHSIIANNMIPEVSLNLIMPLFLFINFAEAYRANKGWVEPSSDTWFMLRDNYYPGDLGFDPLGLKPTNPVEFKAMQEKELSNGRLAMLAAIGFIGQELATGQPVLDSLA